MSFWKHAKLLGPLLSVAIVGVCIGSSLTGYELPSYEIEAHAAQIEEGEPAASNDDIMAAGSWELDDGVYRGTGVGYNGDVTVDVTIADKTITQIDIVSESDDDAFFNRAKGVIDEIISSQSLEVDVVSGATYSSNGIINAVRNALTGEEDNSETPEQAEPKGSTDVAKVEETAAYRDGTYYGTGTGFGGEMTVKVVISGGKIASVEVVSHKDDAPYFNKASVLLSRIVEMQSTNVDTVSGATYSSVGIIQATRDALSKAAVDPTEAQTLAAAASDSPSANKSNKPNANTNVDMNATPAVTGNFPYLDGIYTGTAEGWGGDITVSVTIKDQTMTKIEVTSHEDETEEYYNCASAVIPEMIESQSTDVDVVSGATYSSNGIINAVKEALKAAEEAANKYGNEIKEPDEGSENPDTENNNGTGNENSDEKDDNDGEITEGVIYKNGTYTGSARCTDLEYMEFDYELGLTITVANDRITDIFNITEDGVPYTNGTENKAYLKRAAEGRSSSKGVVSQILGFRTVFDDIILNTDTTNLSTDENTINAVSGATYSSESIYYAVKNALEQAKIDEGNE